jgi:hypothetical protein
MNAIRNVKFQEQASFKITVFMDVTPYSLVDISEEHAASIFRTEE